MRLKDKCCTWSNGQVQIVNHKWIPTYLKTSLSNGQHLKWLWCSGCHLYKMESAKEEMSDIIPA